MAMLTEHSRVRPGHIVNHCPDGEPNQSYKSEKTTLDKEQLRGALAQLSHFVVAIGGTNGRARWEIHQNLKSLNLQPVNLVSGNCHLDKSLALGAGLVVMPGVTVNKFCSIGEQCIINTGATIDHECKIGDGVHVMGSAAIAGRVTIEAFASIGTNATILPDVTIGSGAIIGAGAVVTKNIPSNTVAVGVPATLIRKQLPVESSPRPSWFEDLVT